MKRRNSFTLVEVVVVIVIMVLTGTIATSALRSDSASRLIRKASWDFRAFCSRVRYHALSSGEDRLVVYNPENSCFYMAKPMSEEDAFVYSGEYQMYDAVKWKMPSEFELSTESVQPAEVFRFFPDGGASGVRMLSLACTGKDKALVIQVSALTGTVRAQEMTREEF